VESKWKNYHITTFLDSLSPKTEKLSLEEAVDLSRDRNEMNEMNDSLYIIHYSMSGWKAISVEKLYIIMEGEPCHQWHGDNLSTT
jgi:hypothetical protein